MALALHKTFSAAVAVVVLVAETSAQETNLPDLSTATATQGTTTGVAPTTLVITSSESTTATLGSISPISASSTDAAGLTGLPTLTGGFTIVAPSVPPTQNAPYMRQSNLPEGTVFIVVGAVLSFFAVSLLAWRMGVAWALHRSVKRAALQQSMADTKSIFPGSSAKAAPFYKYSDRDSTISLSGMGQKCSKKSARPLTSAGSTNLFFSPTAGAAGAGIANGGSRTSSYLPAGYYAAGAAAAGNGATNVPIGGPGISLSSLAPKSHSRPKSPGPSPPESPRMNADGIGRMASSSMLNLNQTQGYGSGERAPSAYLEGLFGGGSGPLTPARGHHRQNSASARRI